MQAGSCSDAGDDLEQHGHAVVSQDHGRESLLERSTGEGGAAGWEEGGGLQE